MPILCIDIGNSSAHSGILEKGQVLSRRDTPTRHFVAADSVARSVLEQMRECDCEGLAFASVVPDAAKGVTRLLEQMGLSPLGYQLRHDTASFIGFDYPSPAEVGQDRIANVIAAKQMLGSPAVVIDMGTATTFDVLTSKGYAGGIIAPGLALMTDYLHEKTALLPKLERMELLTPGAIGKSTVEAMKIGAHIGFRGMIKEMLKCVMADLEAAGEGRAHVLTTGGNAIVLPEGWWPNAKHVPDLALFGLEIAFRHARG
ncbi:MAG: type III pantothenate kinase [Opitutales bacterium]|nr:type III pantothenate kinase [Opitutales bacterium]